MAFLKAQEAEVKVAKTALIVKLGPRDPLLLLCDFLIIHSALTVC